MLTWAIAQRVGQQAPALLSPFGRHLPHGHELQVAVRLAGPALLARVEERKKRVARVNLPGPQACIRYGQIGRLEQVILRLEGLRGEDEVLWDDGILVQDDVVCGSKGAGDRRDEEALGRVEERVRPGGGLRLCRRGLGLVGQGRAEAQLELGELVRADFGEALAIDLPGCHRRAPQQDGWGRRSARPTPLPPGTLTAQELRGCVVTREMSSTPTWRAWKRGRRGVGVRGAGR